MDVIDRSQFLPEIQQNPWLLKRLADMVHGEVGLGRDPQIERIQLESAFNRAQARGIPLSQALLSVADDRKRGYYASDTYARPVDQQKLDYFQKQILGPVLQGSDTSSQVLGFRATGNASGDYAANRAANGIYGTSKWYSGKPGVGEMFVTERPDMKWAGGGAPMATRLASTMQNNPLQPVPQPQNPFDKIPLPGAQPDNTFGHSPDAIADAQAAGVWNPPAGFPAMKPMGQQYAGLQQPEQPADPFGGIPTMQQPTPAPFSIAGAGGGMTPSTPSMGGDSGGGDGGDGGGFGNLGGLSGDFSKIAKAFGGGDDQKMQAPSPVPINFPIPPGLVRARAMALAMAMQPLSDATQGSMS